MPLRHDICAMLPSSLTTQPSTSVPSRHILRCPFISTMVHCHLPHQYSLTLYLGSLLPSTMGLSHPSHKYHLTLQVGAPLALLPCYCHWCCFVLTSKALNKDALLPSTLMPSCPRHRHRCPLALNMVLSCTRHKCPLAQHKCPHALMPST